MVGDALKLIDYTL